MNPDGRVAVVTGASSGIGAATARALAREGATVVAVARRKDRLEEVVEDCGRHAPDSVVHAADVTDRAACAALVEQTEARFRGVDILVNNAGIPMRRHVDDLTVEDVERAIAVNFVGAVHLMLAVLPGMRERDVGAIVNVTSVSADIPVPRAAAYGASKAALDRFTDGLAVDLAGSGVFAGVVSPGPIDTEIWDRGAEAAQYSGRLFPPEVVADAIVATVRHERVHTTAPRRYGLLPSIYPLVRRPFQAALATFARRSGAPPAEHGPRRPDR